MSNILDEVALIVDKTEFWHWTWSEHYDVQKYQAQPMSPGKVNVLEVLINQGLIPKEDLFNIDRSNTTCLTRTCFYARLYAYLNQYEWDEPIQDHVSRLGICCEVFWEVFRRWVKNICLRVYEIEDGEDNQKKAINYSLRRLWYIYKKSRNWSTTFRQDGRYQRRCSGVLWNGLSDNPNNFPIVVGVKSGIVEWLLPVREAAMIFEQRVSEIIPSSSFSCLVVPQDRVHEVQKKSNAIPVVSLESLILLERWKYPSLAAMLDATNPPLFK